MYSGMKWERVMREQWWRQIDGADSGVNHLHRAADVPLVAADSAINQGLSAVPTAYYIKMTNK